MPAFPATFFDLATITPATGAIINVPGYSSFFAALSSAGDINGDGIDDFIIGVPGDGLGDYSGAAYVVFGRAGGLPAVNLGALTGAEGFRITGVTNSQTGSTVSGAGDINGDGIDDLIVGAPFFGYDIGEQAAAYIIFGRNTAVVGDFQPEIFTASLNGVDGFTLRGGENLGEFGRAVSSVGDVNGDGIDDVVIMAQVPAYGAAYVVFGKTGGFGSLVDLDLMSVNDGFVIRGTDPNGPFAFALGGGDINGDGLGDIVISAATAGNGAGASFVVFGQNAAVTGGFAPEIYVTDLIGENGFRIDGAVTGSPGSQLGRSLDVADINGDGFDDLILGAPYDRDQNGVDTGGGAVVFGKADGFAAALNVGSLDGSNGFRIAGPGYSAGASIASAGDVNGDGFDDLIIGARFAGYAYGRQGAGVSYVVFGRADGFAATLDLTSLDGSNGFRILGAVQFDRTGLLVAGAGDINGDGFDDLLVRGDNVGIDSGTVQPTLYIIYGHSPVPVATAGDDTLSGGAGNDTLDGLAGKDILYGLGGSDEIYGGEGADQLFGGDGGDVLLGGLGSDILVGDADDDFLYGEDGADKLFGGTGLDNLSGGAGNDRIAGGDDRDWLDGEDGNDYLDGGLGHDIMTGGSGNDVYIVDEFGDETHELAGGGYDIVRTAGTNWTLDTNIEGLELQGSADIAGSGNAGANNIQGNAGANRLDGDLGVDTLNGNDGDDIIIGGLGNDLLRGGLGADAFAVRHIAAGVLETDQIYDFSDAEGDYLDLTDAFAGTLSQVAAFSKVAGQMTVALSGGNTVVRLDLNGDGKADYQVKINGDVTDHATAWLL